MELDGICPQGFVLFDHRQVSKLISSKSPEIGKTWRLDSQNQHEFPGKSLEASLHFAIFFNQSCVIVRLSLFFSMNKGALWHSRHKQILLMLVFIKGLAQLNHLRLSAEFFVKKPMCSF